MLKIPTNESPSKGKSRARRDEHEIISSPSRKGTKSPSKLSKSSPLQSKAKENSDEITRDKLLHIADENVEQSDNFLIETKAHRLIRVMISDYQEFEDHRLTPEALRKLFYLKPSIAELLLEEMLDSGLIEGVEGEEGEEDGDEEEGNEDEEAEEEETSVGQGKEDGMRSPNSLKREEETVFASTISGGDIDIAGDSEIAEEEILQSFDENDL